MNIKDLNKRTLIIARGLPGSGKSFGVDQLCKSLDEDETQHWLYHVCSSDHFFIENGKYNFNINKLGQAHKQCQDVCDGVMSFNYDIVIIDNTNVSAKECRIYVEMGLRHDYRIEFLEPSTPWAFDLDELENRNQHNVPRHALESMLRRWVPDMTVEKAMGIQQESTDKHKDEQAAEEAWETKDCNVVYWNKEQTEYLRKKLNSFKKKDDYNEQAG